MQNSNIPEYPNEQTDEINCELAEMMNVNIG